MTPLHLRLHLRPYLLLLLLPLPLNSLPHPPPLAATHYTYVRDALILLPLSAIICMLIFTTPV
jgi:hypothetical protein